MGTGLRRAAVATGLALAIAAGSFGGVAEARNPCPTGNGSCVVNDPNNFSLTANIAPISPF